MRANQASYQANKYKNRPIYKPPPEDDNTSNFKKLIIVIIISLLFIAGQFIGGIISHSISVISDAFHLITDLVGFILAYAFIWMSKKKPTDQMSFGYHRMELLGALGNLFLIWALAAFLLYQATTRIINKQFVRQPLVMLIVAVGSFPVNIIMYFVLHGSGSHSHGLMGQECAEEPFQGEQAGQLEPCHGALCQDNQCLAENQYAAHCHDGTRIHHHNQINQPKNAYVSLSPKKSHNHDHNHGHHHDHDHDHDHDHHHDHDHDHDHGHDHHDHSHHNHSHQNMSMKAAVLHALSDIIQSIGLIISSLIIFFFGSQLGHEVTQWNDVHYCDPITTYIFCVIVIVSTIPITKNCYHIIMESTPGHISIAQLHKQFSKVPGVTQIHDLHVWDLRPGKTILIAHVFSGKGQQTSVLKRLTDVARRKRIYHSTFQVQQQELRNNQNYILCDHNIH